MPYNPNIPQPTDLLSNSQGDLLQNFQTANTSFGIDHYAFDNPTVNNGKHKHVSLPVQGSLPVPPSGELALTSKLTGSGSALFLSRDNNAAFDVQLTTSSVVAPVVASNGYTFLPGGILLQWGSQAGTGTSSAAIVFPVAFTTVFQAVASLAANTLKYGVASITNTGFSFIADSSFVSVIHWMAIGAKP